MKFKVINDLDIKAQAEELGVSFWRAPSFLFLLLGIVTISAMSGIYYFTKLYDSPEVLIIAESISVIFIFSIGRSIISELEQASRLNKAKSEFISVASHQLRTPLSSISWQIELLLKKFNAGLTDKQREGIEGVGRLSLRMTRLVNDLLNVARIDQKRLYLKNEPIDIVVIIKEIIQEILPLANAKNVNIILGKNENIPLVMADKERIRLVVENILSNAVKYTLTNGKVELNFSQEDNLLLCSIKDNGVGIPINQQQHVFERFFRSDNVLKYQTEGTGLGLYIAKNIIEQLGGEIWFESEENKGTTFIFSIPIKS